MPREDHSTAVMAGTLRVTAVRTVYLPLAAYHTVATRATPTSTATMRLVPLQWCEHEADFKDRSDDASTGEPIETARTRLGSVVSLDLRWLGLTAVPLCVSRLDRIVALDLSHNELHEVCGITLLGMPRLASIVIRWNHLERFLMDIEAEAELAGALAFLHTVDLRNNAPVVETPSWLTDRPTVRIWRDGDHQLACADRVASAAQPPPLHVGGHPPLLSQLAPLKTSELRRRLVKVFGVDAEVVQMLLDRGAVMNALCLQHAHRFPTLIAKAGRPTTTHHGQPLPPDLVAALLVQLQATEWPPRQRPKLESGHYMTLGEPRKSINAAPTTRKQKKAQSVFEQHRALWDAARQALASVDPDFEYTDIAVSHNFRGSPHIDVNDISYQ